MTVHILSAGDGYAYYTNEVATGDAKRDTGRELGDYYTADGNPPGVWVGSGIDQLGVSGQVTEEQMKALYGEGLHPNADAMIAAAIADGATPVQAVKAAKLGRSYYGFSAGATQLQAAIIEGYARFERENHREPTADERRRIRVREGAQAFRAAKLRDPVDKEELGRFITAATRPTAQAVAGFDLVFSPAKSVSVLWALGDTPTRKAIEQAHEQAIADSIEYLEREAIATRAGTNGVAQIDVLGGLIATRFRHYDSRTGDPQLHDHVVVANKVRGVDGKWRTIDSKLLHRQGVAASEFYNARVMERVTDALGLATELREVTPGKRPVVELKGIDDQLVAMFSSRSQRIKAAVARLEAEYESTHGRAPDSKARIALAQQATLETRPAKEHARSLAELRAEWRETAVAAVGNWPVERLLRNARRAGREPHQHDPDARTHYTLQEAAEAVVDAVSEHRAVWGPHMVEAEARRFVSTQRAAGVAVDGTVEDITRHALGASIEVTPPGPHAAFAPLTRADGTSIYDHKGRTLLTSQTILDAEDILLTGGREPAPAPVPRDVFGRVADRENAALRAEGKALDEGQLALARAFACGDRRLIIGIGAAGTGKTTALQVAALAVEEHGSEIIGLAYSATAAAVLEDAAGIRSSTLHSFLQDAPSLRELEKDDSRLGILTPGTVVVVDEAGMAGSVNLARLMLIAWRDGAYVRLLGDDRQLGAVEAGGALRLLERELGSVQLDALYRFANSDEAAASLLLRDPTRTGDPFAWYTANGRVTGGATEIMHGDVFAGWQHDVNAGLSSLMIASSSEAVTELNTRAQAYRMSTGDVHGDASVELRDGLDAHVGDIIVTRKNNRRITVSRGRDVVKNGDLWAIDQVHEDGSLTVTHQGHGGTATLPADYVSTRVDLGYALTVHRSQGVTVDTAHLLADAATTREAAYVGLTRGRHANHLYVDAPDAQLVTDVLAIIAGNIDGMLSAHDTIRAEQDRVDNLPALVEQYQDASERFALHRHRHLAHQVLFDLGEDLTSRDSFGAVSAALTRAEQVRIDPRVLLETVAHQRELGTADDVGAVFSYRLEKYLADRREQALTAALGAPTTVHLSTLDSYDQVHDVLHRLEARGDDVADTVREVWFADSIDAVDDAGAVLASRLEQHMVDTTAPTADTALPHWIAPPVSPFAASVDDDWVDHLQERYDHLTVHFEQRREILAADPPEWAAQLGPIPQEPARRDAWTQLAAEIDVFRERYNITTPEPVPAEYQNDTTGKDLATRLEQLQRLAAVDAEKTRALRAREAMMAKARARTAATEEALRRTGTTLAPSATTTDVGADDHGRDTRTRDDDLER